VLLSVAYDGRDYHGFAQQPGQRTVAGELLGALRSIDPGIVEVRGASRTDRGVHARDQRVAFDPSREMPLSAWTHGAQKQLPASLSIRAAWQIEAGYNPRHHTIAKTYRYLLLADAARDPFMDGRAWRVPELLEGGAIELMQAEAAVAVGQHDFAAFRGALDKRDSTVRTLSKIELTRAAEQPRVYRVDVRGDAFMYNMVRILVGTLVDVGRRRQPPGAIARALASKDRRSAGITAPPDGLYLEHYELKGDDERPFEPEQSGCRKQETGNRQ